MAPIRLSTGVLNSRVSNSALTVGPGSDSRAAVTPAIRIRGRPKLIQCALTLAATSRVSG